MAARLPPLNALRAFEAAARHLSFAKAADELAVTPAAVSHQIKGLEAQLGTALFRRYNRQVLLTDAGQALAPGVRDGLAAMAAAVERVHAVCSRGPLTVTVPPSFAVKWLMPRLERFRSANPEIDVRISATDRLVDLEREEVDLAVRYGAGPYPGLRGDRLLGESMFPVCSPRLLEGPHPLRTPADLIHHTLLHEYVAPRRSGPFPDWRMWLRAAGIEGIDAERGPSYEPASMVVQAAIEGEGVALGRSVLVAEDIAAGRLVRPFETVMPTEFGYWVVTTEAAAQLPRAQAFRQWLLDEVAADAASREAAREE